MTRAAAIQLVGTLFAASALAQNASLSAYPTITSITYTTTTFNYSAASTYLPLTDFSNEQLQLLWDQVGLIESAAITTVSPTPEPSTYPKPNFVHPLVPAYVSEVDDAKLPEDFLWGVASAALQVEVAADAEGKGPSVWDLLPHRWTNSILDNTTADITSNSYYLYKQDNARLASLGIQSYSFNFGWARFFPFGRGSLNEEGVKHYDDFFDDLEANGIIPVATLFHWDTLLALFNSYGAWTSRDIVDDYVNYAKYVIERYDDRVHTWYTFNEPQYCNWRFSTYPWGTILPEYNGIGKGGGVRAEFLCGHYTQLDPDQVYKWYKNEYKGTKPMTFRNSANYTLPNSTSAADAVAVTRVNDFNMGWFGGCWTDGDYPESLRSTLGDILPKYTDEEKALIQGSCDFYAIDAYTTYYAAAPANGLEACVANRTDPNFPQCAVTSSVKPDGFPIGPNADVGATWLYSTPGGFPQANSIVVSEFGFSDPYEQAFNTLPQILWDLRRADYIQSFLDNILAARALDGVNVTGAFAWAIYDNFEWNSGLGTEFGLQYVNLTSYERHPKASMVQFLNWFQKHWPYGNGTVNVTAPIGKVRRTLPVGGLF